MKFGRITKSVVFAGAASLVLAGCAGSDSSGGSGGGGDDTYDVMVTAGLSAQGVLAANAQTSVLAAKAGAKVINEQGGIGGKQVELTVVDDGGDPTTAVTKLREAINSGDKPDLFLDSGPSTIAMAVLPVLKQNKILSFNISPAEGTDDPSKFPLNFDIAPGPESTNRGIAQYAKEQGYNSIGILHSNSGSGEAYGAAAKEQITAAGMNVVGTETFDTASLDMTPQLLSLKNAGAKVLVLDAYGAPLGHVLDNMQRLGWDVPIIGETTVSATNLIARTPPEGVLGTPKVENLVTQVFQSMVYDPDDENVNTMIDTMAGLGKITTTSMLAYNYDAFFLVAAAAEETGNTDPHDLADALTDPSVQEKAETAVLPRYNFTEERHASNPAPDVYRYVAPTPLVNGQFGNPDA
ncbi:ABC transporter substrate-binding protein [Tomitella gaofuii]|uniref:ABC transporter substrate-binding protein n=1 Tax=Tomitella gaofuii TaxID=2760083 RepID=UPI0015FD10DC|nr:ABC transporter substrate-binding protein [Tomitella gaofuii]